MAGEKDLDKLLKTIKPKHNPGDYVFCTLEESSIVNSPDVLLLFKEQEGDTVILRKELADSLNLGYSFIASWITLTVHSSLEGVGLTAAFSKALAEEGISCNVVAAFYHDHLFVNKKDTERAIEILDRFSEEKSPGTND
jgi:hypothetical protein